MKKLIVMMLALAAAISASAQGITFLQKPLAEVLAMAKEQNKLVFVDIYTSWCGPCRHMAQEIFPQPEVGEYFNANFISLKVDAEKDADGPAMLKKYSVTAFPTLLFLDGNGDLVYRFMGARQPDKLIEEGKRALESFAAQPKLKEFGKRYAAGDRDKAFLDEYCDMQAKNGLDCSEVAMEYFKQISDSELLDSVNLARVGKVTVYNHDFAHRIADAVLADSVAIRESKNRSAYSNKAVCGYLTAALGDAMRKSDDAGVEDLFAVKKYYFDGADLKETIVMASLGGGTIYLPTELTRTKYYIGRKDTATVISSVEEYMAKLAKKYAEEDETFKKLEAEMEKKLADLKAAGKDEDYNTAKKGFRLSCAFAKMDNNYIASDMIDLLDDYARMYPASKNQAFTKQMNDWYVLLGTMSPSARNAVQIADKLIELGDKENARKMLQLAIETGKDAMGVEQSHIDACTAKLKEIG